MFACPNCPHTALTQVRTEGGLLWHCPRCDGRVLNLSMLRRRVPHQSVTKLWHAILAKEESGGLPSPKRCPSCQAPMWEVIAPDAGHPLELDACRPCHFIWFDQGELGKISRAEVPAEPSRPIAPAPTLQVDYDGDVRYYRVHSPEADEVMSPPDEWWQVICNVLGLPVEENAPEQTSLPVTTWILAALMIFVYLAGVIAGDANDLIWQFGFVPSDPFRYFGLTIVSSFLLHGGLVHLLGNLYFFLVFGDNTENHLGPFKYLCLLLLATAAGDFSHALVDPGSDIPLVGASGGISGILMFYALQFRQVRIVFMLRWWVVFRFFRISIKWALLLWVLFQLFGAFQQVNGLSNVSALAHLGGASAGVLVYFLNRWWTEQGTVMARIRKEKRVLPEHRSPEKPREKKKRRRQSSRSLRKPPEKKQRRRKRRKKSDRPDLWSNRPKH